VFNVDLDDVSPDGLRFAAARLAQMIEVSEMTLAALEAIPDQPLPAGARREAAASALEHECQLVEHAPDSWGAEKVKRMMALDRRLAAAETCGQGALILLEEIELTRQILREVRAELVKR
jgi:hypothetical protein